MRLLLICLLSASMHCLNRAQEIIPLYADSIPNSIPNEMTEYPYNWNGAFSGYRSISKPTLEIFLPPSGKANGTAIIICPGGAYAKETYLREGTLIAGALIKQGITAIILKYRLPSDSIMQDKSIGPLQDAQQALRITRLHAGEWKLDAHRIGIMGFSAGGHLAASAATHFDSSFIPNEPKVNLRPDFLILVYPVVSMTDELSHPGSRENLLGKNPSKEKIEFFSNENQVSDQTPPCWITHAGDDQIVPVENSIVLYNALQRHHVPVEMHLYPKGDHGFVLKILPEIWMHPLFEWMQENNWINYSK
jgi:acetyl esterase/lipase